MLGDHKVTVGAHTLAHEKNRSHTWCYGPEYASVYKQVFNTFRILQKRYVYVINKFPYGSRTLPHTLVRRERREILCMHKILRRT